MHTHIPFFSPLCSQFNRRQLTFEQQRKDLLKQLLHLKHMFGRMKSLVKDKSDIPDDMDLESFDLAAQEVLQSIKQEAHEGANNDSLTVLRQRLTAAEGRCGELSQDLVNAHEEREQLQRSLHSRKDALNELRQSKLAAEKTIKEQKCVGCYVWLSVCA